MKTITRLALACAAALTLSAPSFADVIVDTGAGVTAYGSGAGLQHDQWLASTFTLSGRETITGINGWIGGNAGTLQLAVRSAQNGLPGAVLFSTDLQASTWFTNDWVGASNLDWTLDAGTYFVAFQVPTGYTFGGGMGNGVASPAGPVAFTDELNNWHLDPFAQIGYQVFGEPAGNQDSANVPEPSTMALSGLALAGLAFARKRAGKARA